ncbi:hypothetical protein IAI19_11540, partial [Streptococcus pseudopneumoniae]|uniref:hypothetical protein n=1 Tax=Streptococcus pseudopneumoniae TaxID=257758 RepID=UPI0018B0BC8B
MDKNPRICLSAGHGLSSRRPGQVDPGASVVDYDGDEADIVLNLAKSVHADLTRLFRVKGRGVSFLRNSGVYYR